MPYIPSEKTDLSSGDDRSLLNPSIENLSNKIALASKRHGYDGAFAGELNYVITRLLQEIPRSLIKKGIITEELRYWIQPLMYGVLLDVVLEHKRRVNVSYEAAQIVKSGDCYDTPYYTRLVEIVDEEGNHIGHQEVMLKRSEWSKNKDLIGSIVIKKLP